ncbi:MAG: hypothetical protein LBU73_00515 [Helicobacteraceae bacterium]|nr:hypothetical protein [Helicobacteraceae bacterium]
MKEIAEKQDRVLLDYNTNEDIENYKKPLSRAGLVKRYLFKKYPELQTLFFERPKTQKKQQQAENQCGLFD